MTFTWFWSMARVAVRRKAIAATVAVAGSCGLFGLMHSGSPHPAGPSADSEPPLTVVPAGYTLPGDTSATDPSPDSARLKSAYESAGAAIEGREALVRSLALLSAGCDNLESIPDYTSTFVRRERIEGILRERDAITMKLRHKPLALYLSWTEGPETGRELIYAEGKNDGDMIVHPGGWKGKVLPPFKLNPHGNVAMSFARHPVTDLGLAAVGRRIIAKRTPDVQRSGGYRFQIDENSEVEGRPALRCELVFDSQSVSDFYRKMIYYIDREMLIPVAMCTYAWPDTADLPPETLDEETLVEDYLFTNIRFRNQLADADFDTANEQYHFRR